MAVYLAGHGVQLEGENYLLPVDARIERDVRRADRRLPRSPTSFAPSSAARLRRGCRRRHGAGLSPRLRRRAGGQGPRAHGTACRLPGGLLLGSQHRRADGQGPLRRLCDRVGRDDPSAGPAARRGLRPRPPAHARGHERQQIPWHTANLGNASFAFFEQAERRGQAAGRAEVRRIEDVPPEEAYAIAVERDTIQDYQDFLRRYPDRPLARRVTALLAARREAVVWRRTLAATRGRPTGPICAITRTARTPPTPPQARAPLGADAPPPSSTRWSTTDLPPPLPGIERVEVVEVGDDLRDVAAAAAAPAYLLPRRDEDDELRRDRRPRAAAAPIMAGVLPIPMPIPVPCAPARRALLSAHRADDPARAGRHPGRAAAGHARPSAGRARWSPRSPTPSVRRSADPSGAARDAGSSAADPGRRRAGSPGRSAPTRGCATAPAVPSDPAPDPGVRPTRRGRSASASARTAGRRLPAARRSAARRSAAPPLPRQPLPTPPAPAQGVPPGAIPGSVVPRPVPPAAAPAQPVRPGVPAPIAPPTGAQPPGQPSPGAPAPGAAPIAPPPGPPSLQRPGAIAAPPAPTHRISSPLGEPRRRLARSPAPRGPVRAVRSRRSPQHCLRMSPR